MAFAAALPLASGVLDLADKTVGIVKFFMEIAAKHREEHKVNSLWGYLSFKKPTVPAEINAAIARLPLGEQPAANDVAFLVYIHVGFRIGTSGISDHLIERTSVHVPGAGAVAVSGELFGLVRLSTFRAYEAAARALMVAEANATSNANVDPTAHAALCAAKAAMVPFASSKFVWDLLASNDVVELLRDRLTAVSTRIVGRYVSTHFHVPVVAERDALLQILLDDVITPLRDTFSQSNLRPPVVAPAPVHNALAIAAALPAASAAALAPGQTKIFIVIP